MGRGRGRGRGWPGGAGPRSRVRSSALISTGNRLPAGQNCLSQLCPSYHFPPEERSESWMSLKKKTEHQNKLLPINASAPSPALPAVRPPVPGAGCGTRHRPPQFLTAPSPSGSCRKLPGSPHTPEDMAFVAAAEAGHTELCRPPPAAPGECQRNPKRSNTAPFLSFQSQTKAKQAAWN